MRIFHLLLLGISISLTTALSKVDSTEAKTTDQKDATTAKPHVTHATKLTKESKKSTGASTIRLSKSIQSPGDNRGKRNLHDFGNAGYLYSNVASRRAGYTGGISPQNYYPQTGYYNGQTAFAQYPQEFSGHYSQYPQYLEAPEPIIEIIIKDSNETLPAPVQEPIITKKKKEKVHVFYVNYKKDHNNKLHLESPIASLNNDETVEEEEEILQIPVPVTQPPPLRSTTLRTIIHPDSEKYHSNSGIHVTFGTEDKSQTGHILEEHDAESIQNQVVALPDDNNPNALVGLKSDEFSTQEDARSPAGNQLFEAPFQRSNYYQADLELPEQHNEHFVRSQGLLAPNQAFSPPTTPQQQKHHPQTPPTAPQFYQKLPNTQPPKFLQPQTSLLPQPQALYRKPPATQQQFQQPHQPQYQQEQQQQQQQQQQNQKLHPQPKPRQPHHHEQHQQPKFNQQQQQQQHQQPKFNQQQQQQQHQQSKIPQPQLQQQHQQPKIPQQYQQQQQQQQHQQQQQQQAHYYANFNQQFQHQTSFNQPLPQKSTQPTKSSFVFPTVRSKLQELPSRQLPTSYQPIKFRPTPGPITQTKPVPIPAKLENTNFQTQQTSHQYNSQTNYQKPQQTYQHQPPKSSNQPLTPYFFTRQPQFVRNPSFTVYSPIIPPSYKTKLQNSNFQGPSQYVNQKVTQSNSNIDNYQTSTQNQIQNKNQNQNQNINNVQSRPQNYQQDLTSPAISHTSINNFEQSAPNMSTLQNYFDIQPSKETELLKSIPKFEQHITETIHNPLPTGTLYQPQSQTTYNDYSLNNRNQVIHDIPAPNLGPTTQAPTQQSQSDYIRENVPLSSGHYNSASNLNSQGAQQQYSSFVTNSVPSTTAAPQFAESTSGQKIMIVTPMPPIIYNQYHSSQYSSPDLSNTQQQQYSTQNQAVNSYVQQPRQSQSIVQSSLNTNTNGGNTQYSVSTYHSDVFRELEQRKQQKGEQRPQQNKQQNNQEQKINNQKQQNQQDQQYRQQNNQEQKINNQKQQNQQDQQYRQQNNQEQKINNQKQQNQQDQQYRQQNQQQQGSNTQNSQSNTENIYIPQNKVENTKTAQTTQTESLGAQQNKATQNLFQLPDEVPDDLRQQLLSSGILNNADISVLDYDKIGAVNLENLPAEHLQHFYGNGGGAQVSESKKVLTVLKPNGEQLSINEKEFDRVKTLNSVPKKHNLDVKVVHFDSNNQKIVSNKYLKSDATVVPPVNIADRQYNRYLPLKINGAQFPIPDVEELHGKKVVSVVVLAPVEGDSSSEARSSHNDGSATEAKEIKFLNGDLIKTLVKKPSKENFKRWLEKEAKTDVEQQSVVLLVTNDSEANEKEIFMYDITTGVVNKLNGELSSKFVNVAEENASSEDLEHASTLDPSALEHMMQPSTSHS